MIEVLILAGLLWVGMVAVLLWYLNHDWEDQ